MENTLFFPSTKLFLKLPLVIATIECRGYLFKNFEKWEFKTNPGREKMMGS